MAGIAREYRDSLLKFIFGKEENKEWTLSLYNALRDSDSAHGMPAASDSIPLKM